MNAITPMVDPTVGVPAITDIKHFVLAIDPDTGEEVRIEVVPDGEFSQEADHEINAFASASALDEAERTVH